jgi:hypothetical protein
VGKHKTIRLCDLSRLVVVIKSVDTGVGVQKVAPDQCDTVQNLTLCIGAKVMLTQNIWVELGLVNGTTGTVEDVVWKEHTDVKKDQPQALLIALDGYSGPALFTQQDGRKVFLSRSQTSTNHKLLTLYGACCNKTRQSEHLMLLL